MNDFALILCVMAGIVALVAAISLCIAMMLWMIGLTVAKAYEIRLAEGGAP